MSSCLFFYFFIYFSRKCFLTLVEKRQNVQASAVGRAPRAAPNQTDLDLNLSTSSRWNSAGYPTFLGLVSSASLDVSDKTKPAPPQSLTDPAGDPEIETGQGLS